MLSRLSRLPRFLAPLVVVLAALGLSSMFIRVMLEYNGGRPGSPVDDAYIYYTYARHLATGHFYEYNPGDGMSTGATSYLWTAVLALGYRLGFRGDRIIWWAVGLGVFFLSVYGLLLLRLGRRLFHHRAVAALFAVAVLLDARVGWGFFSGMEVGLFTVALIATIESILLARARPTRGRIAALAASLSLLVLVRPEGQVLGAIACAVILVQKLQEKPRGGLTRWQTLVRDRATLVAVAIPGALVLGFYALLYAKLGHLAQNGMRTKSHLFAPDQTFWVVLGASSKFYRDMLFTHFPWHFDAVGKGALAVFVFTGMLVGAARELWIRRPGMMVLAALWFVLGLLLQSIVLNAAYHHGRYVMNYTFMYWLCFAAGVFRWLRWHRIPIFAKRLAAGGAMALVCAVMVGTLPVFRHNFGNDIRTINAQQVAMAEHMAKTLPKDAVVAMNDVGAGGYYAERYIVDVYGLTTNEVAPRKWEGQACILEELIHGVPKRPNYFAIYPTWYRTIVDLGLLKFITKYHVDPPHINGGDDMGLYSVDWKNTLDESLAHQAKAELAKAGVKIVDHMDEAYREDEIAHDYHWGRQGKDSQWGSDLLRFIPYVGIDSPSLVDGGRTVREWESWSAKNLTPGKDLWIVRRTTGVNDRCRVLVDGKQAGFWEPAADVAGRYRDESFKVPGSLITRSKVKLRFEIENDKAKKARHPGGAGYDVYYVWLAQ